LKKLLRVLVNENSGLKLFVDNNLTFSDWAPRKIIPDLTLTGGTVVNSPCN